jgi:hypothetical protein
MSDSPLLSFVNKYLVVEGLPCGRHCNKPVKFHPLDSGTELVGAYVDPEYYVSRVVYFSEKPNSPWFENFLKEQGGEPRVRKKDIRYATRHGWELGGNAEEEISQVSPDGIREYYWTFYAQNDADKQEGTFFCAKENGGCGRLFTQKIAGAKKLCPRCST